jgi:FAD binding domain
MAAPELNASPVKPKASPLPPRPTTDPLTPDQWKTLLAIADTVIPTIVPQSVAKPATELSVDDNSYSTILSKLQDTCLASGSVEPELAKQFLAERGSENPAFKEALYRYLAFYLPSDLKKKLTLGLDLLSYRAGALILTGYPTPFHAQPIATREAIIQSWATARIPTIRQLFKSLTLLVKQNWVKTSPTVGKIIGFPRIPLHGKPSPGFQFEFLQIPPGDEVEVIETDVVVVGSGCGGAVVARNLAESGQRVLVVDKAYHWPAEHLPMTEADAFTHMFLNGGALFCKWDLL